MAADNKTQPTDASVEAFVAAIDHEERRTDALRLLAIYRRITGEEPRLWGPSIIGYGSYHYRYASGREGDAPRAGFSPRKASLSLYVLGADCGSGASDEEARLLARLGRHKIGKSCLYVNRLDDIDVAVLEELIALSLATMDARYPR